ncbi:MAG: hypothetical protein KF699_09140 [Phycisphaeraceae bacterium]|nr:hypothetical protein [Phycisphaeraceae bacterium]MBX3406348.1 hypothetical protein [Phycisphaeraceae bacterium]
MDAGLKPTTDSGARRLAGIIEEEHALCVELDGLSIAQSAMVEGGDTDGVLEVLGRRQRIIDRIVVLNAELAPLRDRREQLMAALPAIERERVRARVDEIAQTVERVRARDEQDRDAMERRRTGIAGELSGLARARGAVAAYGTPRGPDGGGARFQDREG